MITFTKTEIELLLYLVRTEKNKCLERTKPERLVCTDIIEKLEQEYNGVRNER